MTLLTIGAPKRLESEPWKNHSRWVVGSLLRCRSRLRSLTCVSIVEPRLAGDISGDPQPKPDKSVLRCFCQNAGPSRTQGPSLQQFDIQLFLPIHQCCPFASKPVQQLQRKFRCRDGLCASLEVLARREQQCYRRQCYRQRDKQLGSY